MIPKKSTSLAHSPQGFSLMEIIAVMGILAIMTSATVVGFGALGDSIKVREVAGIISDTIKKAELEILGDDYAKTMIYFEKDYLVMVSEPKEKNLSLMWEGQGGGCGATEERLTSTDNGNLIKKNGNGVSLGITTITPPLAECVDFSESKEDREWNYQIKNGSDVSEVIRLVDFNVYSSDASSFYIEDNNYRLEISGPYARKKLYENGVKATGSSSLTIHDSNDSMSADLNLQI